MPISHKEFHENIKNAISEMKNIAKKYDQNIREFSERQLVHEIGYTFRNNYWIGFEHPYLDTKRVNERARSDLAILNKNKDERIFIEVKSTGFPEDDRRENRFKSLKWEKDFDKLRKLDKKVYKCSLKGYWVWQYFFETYRPKIDEIVNTFKISDSGNFNGPYESKSIAKIFGQIESQNMTLGRVLNEISEKSMDTLISIIPKVKDSNKEFSVLLVTSEVK